MVRKLARILIFDFLSVLVVGFAYYHKFSMVVCSTIAGAVVGLCIVTEDS